MKRYLSILALFLLVLPLAVFFGCGGGSDPVDDPIEDEVNLELAELFEFVSSMKMGWNLGNTMDGNTETGWQSQMTTQATLTGAAAQGFGVVRIPVTWRGHTTPALTKNQTAPYPDYVIDPAWIGRVKEIVDYTLEAGMKAIINIHHDGADSNNWLSVKTEDLRGEAKERIDAQFTTLWTKIAEYFIDYDERLIFEPFNELHDGAWGDGSSVQWRRINELNQIFVDTVRATGGNNATRYLVNAGYVTRAVSTVKGLTVAADTVPHKIMVSFHFYDPAPFTLDVGTTWGEKAIPGHWGNEKNVKDTFDSMRDKFVNNGYPVYIGEYGCGNRSGTNFLYQKYYMEYVTKYAHDCGFVPILWDNNGAGVDGKEQSKMFNRTTGEPATANTAEIMALMKKAVTEDYNIEDIVAP